ncbi:MAG TPA: hypothetical protein VNX65_03505 [Patescibacteria group bacterium]|jgi:hypothetical protein|nr:hypothetical protein [Patescibacteria group bacterium]
MPEQLLTQPSEFEHPSEGYIVIAPLSEASKQRIADIQSQFVERFGEDNLWAPSGDQLHITFAHIITPDAEYKEDRATLFSRLRPLATAALNKTIPGPFTITSQFYAIEASPSAVILKASDDGSFERFRKGFISNFSPPDGTRMPPEIIHTTILRFRNSIDLNVVRQLAQKIMTGFVPFEEQTTVLQMIREKKIFVQEHEVLEEFPSQSYKKI